MPWYSQWDDYLDKKSADYARAKSKVEAKLLAVKHIVDYYYCAAKLELPTVVGTAPAFLKDANPSAKETHVLKMIAHHCTCDGIDFCTLYDVTTLLSKTRKKDRAYTRIILVCANEIRGYPEQFQHPDERRR